MNKLIKTFGLLILVGFLQTKVFALDLDCKFKDMSVAGVKTMKLADDNLIINSDIEIPLEESRVRCGNFGKQTRFDGNALGFQVVLKSCTSEAKLEGVLIDSLNSVGEDVLCQPAASP
jgi:hypothetical protein